MGRLSRFDVRGVVAAHVAHLTYFEDGKRKRDFAARAVLWGVPATATGLSIWLDVRMPSNGIAVATLALLVGAVLAAIPQVIALRRGMEETPGDLRASDADVADEATAHLTLAAIVGIGAAVVATVLSLEIAAPAWVYWPGRVMSGLVLGAMILTFLLILVAMPRLFYLQQRHG